MTRIEAAAFVLDAIDLLQPLDPDGEYVDVDVEETALADGLLRIRVGDTILRITVDIIT